MVRQPNESLDAQKSVPLKLTEPVVDPSNPWADDLLVRKDVATRLTNLIATQEPPLAISLHGYWGTGKTFLLKRWQKDLENQQFKAIYFNAWEDDFCDDPLLAILGQMSETFKEGNLKTLTQQIATTAVTLLKKNALSILSNKTGITLDTAQSERDLLEEYLHERATKDQLKESLAKLSEAVFKETKHPLVFIIDELDRCRPTFAIELLERVKHIFDVRYLVFVFGINQDELCKSLSSIYGDINTDVYLRRFFDFGFNLSEADSHGFATQLIDRFQLGHVFQSLSNKASDRVHLYDYDNYRKLLPKLWSALGLSLRDIDYGIRLLALLTRSLQPRTFTHPFLLVILIAMKFKRPEFYRSLITGNFETSKVMDYIDGELRRDQSDEELTALLDRSEGFLYCADMSNQEDQNRPRGQAAVDELSQTQDVPLLTGSSVISNRAQKAGQWQRDSILRAIHDGRQLYIDGRVFSNLAALIDTYQTQLRR